MRSRTWNVVALACALALASLVAVALAQRIREPGPAPGQPSGAPAEGFGEGVPPPSPEGLEDDWALLLPPLEVLDYDWAPPMPPAEGLDDGLAPPMPPGEGLRPGLGPGPGAMDEPRMGGPHMGGPGMRMRGGMAHRARMLRALDLSPEQREKVGDIREREQRKAIGIRAEIATAMLDMRKLMREEHPDGRRIDAQIDRIAGLRAGLRKAQVAAMLEMRSLLSPEQLRKWRGGRMG